MATNPEAFRVGTPERTNARTLNTDNSNESLSPKDPKKSKIGRVAAALALVGGGVFVGAKAFGGGSESDSVKSTEPSTTLAVEQPDASQEQKETVSEKGDFSVERLNGEVVELSYIQSDSSPEEIMQATANLYSCFITTSDPQCAEAIFGENQDMINSAFSTIREEYKEYGVNDPAGYAHISLTKFGEPVNISSERTPNGGIRIETTGIELYRSNGPHMLETPEPSRERIVTAASWEYATFIFEPHPEDPSRLIVAGGEFDPNPESRLVDYER